VAASSIVCAAEKRGIVGRDLIELRSKSTDESECRDQTDAEANQNRFSFLD